MTELYSGYDDFARFYDILQGEADEPLDYARLAEYYHTLLCQHGVAGGILLDLGCGTGTLSALFSEMGYDVIGVDRSEEMLNQALGKPHDNIQYLKQDMTSLDMFGTIDCCVCALDGINHLLSDEDVRKTFSLVSLFMNKGGLFVFDVNTLHKHNDILADNTYVYDLDELFCVWQNECDDGRLRITLDFFEESEGVYRRYFDEFDEQAYPIADIEQMLIGCGFEVIDVLEWMEHQKGSEDSEKVVFVARKL